MAEGPFILESDWALEGALARAAAHAATQLGSRIGIVMAGERSDGGTWRMAEEDRLGAGAFAHALRGAASSPLAFFTDTEAAAASFAVAAGSLLATLESTESGQELIAAGFEDDVRWAAQYDVSGTVAILEQGVLRDLRLGGASWAR